MNLSVNPASCSDGAAPDGEPAILPASREVELKFTTDSSGLAQALAAPLLRAETRDAPAKNLVSVYFDTPAGDLKREGLILRIRRAGRSAPLMTLKWQTDEAEGLFSRGEIEIRCRALQPDLSLFDEAVAARVAGLIADRPLEPRFETRFKRRTRMVTFGGAQIEVAFDEGAIVAGENSWPLCEVELELKSGDAADLYEFGARLAEATSLKLDVRSKSARAFAWVAGETSKPVKASPLKYPPNAMFDDAVAAVIANTLTHFVSNWAALRESDRPESIHQMRVALRRQRAALAMFKRVLPCAEFDGFRAEAKRIASALGPARECDAFRGLVEDGPVAHFGDKANFGPLMQGLEERRIAAYADARALIHSRQTTVFVARMHAFLARRGWRNTLSGADLGILTAPAEIFAAAALDRLHKRASKRGRKLVTLPDEERHEVRISLKNLRYAAEFFGVFFAGGRGGPSFLRSVARLQDLLGAHNDAASAESFLADAREPEAARAAGVVLGWYGRDAIIADAGLAKAWKHFKNSRIFWV
jgi:triphosphatase